MKIAAAGRRMEMSGSTYRDGLNGLKQEKITMMVLPCAHNPPLLAHPLSPASSSTLCCLLSWFSPFISVYQCLLCTGAMAEQMCVNALSKKGQNRTKVELQKIKVQHYAAQHSNRKTLYHPGNTLVTLSSIIPCVQHVTQHHSIT
jgi:hypothetical protein